MSAYICTHCNFRFNSERSQRDCPYCGKTKLEREKSAAELLSEVEDLLSD